MKDVVLLDNYDLFLFDFDLTLADGSDWIVHSYQRVLAEYGFKEVSDVTVRHTIGLTVEESFQVMTSVNDATLLGELRDAYKAVCRPGIVEHTHFFADAVAFLERLKGMNKTIGVVSTKEASTIKRCFEHRGIEQLPSIVLGRSEVVCAKPSPEGLQKASEIQHISFNKVLYFGDSIVDAEAAQRAPVDFVAVVKGNYAESHFRTFPTKAIIASYDCLG